MEVNNVGTAMRMFFFVFFTGRLSNSTPTLQLIAFAAQPVIKKFTWVSGRRRYKLQGCNLRDEGVVQPQRGLMQSCY